MAARAERRVGSADDSGDHGEDDERADPEVAIGEHHCGDRSSAEGTEEETWSAGDVALGPDVAEEGVEDRRRADSRGHRDS